MAEKINNEKVTTVPENSNEKNSKQKRLFDGFPFKSPMECYWSYCEVDQEAEAFRKYGAVSVIGFTSFKDICYLNDYDDYTEDMFYSDNGCDFQNIIFNYDPWRGVSESVYNDMNIAADTLVYEDYKFFYNFLHKIFSKSDIGFTIMFDETYRFGKREDIPFTDDRIQRFLLFRVYSLSGQKNSFDYVMIFCKHGSDIPIVIPCKIYENGNFELIHPLTNFKRNYEAGFYAELSNVDINKIVDYFMYCENNIIFKYPEYRVWPGISNDDTGRIYFGFMTWQEQCWFNARFVERILNLDWYWHGSSDIRSYLRDYIYSDNDKKNDD